jgi:tetratricopeptide (TPR) repeat protein
LSRLGRQEEALEKYRESLILREKHGYIRAAEVSRNNVAAILKQRGRFNEALVEFEKLLEIGKESNDLGRISITLNHIGDIYRIQGRAREALERHEEALRIVTSGEYQSARKEAESSEDEEGKFIGRRAITLRYLSEAHYELGELDKSLQCCTDALEISRSRGDIVGEGKALYHRGIALLGKKYIEGAIQSLSEALTILEEREPRWVGTVRNGLALAYIAQGDKRRALTNAWEAVESFTSLRSYNLGDARFTLAQSYLTTGDKDKALAWADLAGEKFREMGLEHRTKQVEEFTRRVLSG